MRVPYHINQKFIRMKTTFVYKVFVCLLFLLVADSVAAQEGRYYVSCYLERETSRKENGWFCYSSQDIFYDNLFIYKNVYNGIVRERANEDDGSWGASIGYSLDLKPKSFILNGGVGSKRDGNIVKGADSAEYTEGSGQFELYIHLEETSFGCTRTLDVKYKIVVDDPAIINSVKFEGANSDKSYVCGTSTRIAVSINRYNNGRGDAELQVFGDDKNWHKVKNAPSASTSYVTYDEIKQYVALGNPIQFRTRKTLISYDSSFSTNTNELRYLREFKFPAGKSLIIDPPVCYGGKTTLKIPYEGNISYIYTVSKSSATGENITGSLTSETINGTTYYILSKYFDAGTYTLNIEYQSSGCYFTTTFNVPTIPQFKINKDSPLYLNKVDNYEITKNGGTGGVSISLSNVYCNSDNTYFDNPFVTHGPGYNNVTVFANNQTFSGVISTPTMSADFGWGGRYTDGQMKMDLSAGTYNIFVQNSLGCKSDTLTNIILREPLPVSYNITVSDPKCFGEKGSVSIFNVSGGIGNKKYHIDSENTNNFDVSSFNIDNLSSGSLPCI
jgi:hypothetical protein